MDIYEEDNVISSDEYDDSDDLLNVAVSSTNLKVEAQKTTCNPTLPKPQQKFIRKLGIKLKKKSVKWMQHKFKRDQIRKSYLYSIARAKCINKPSSINTMSGTSAGLNKDLKIEEPKKTIIADQNVSSSAKVDQHETIDLDDSDDDEADDFDQEDDESSTDSSNDEDDDIDEDDDLEEINNDDDEEENEEVEAANNDIISEVVDRNSDIPKTVVQNQVDEKKINNNIPIEDEPKSENSTEKAANSPYHKTPNAQIFNSTIKEQKSQKEPIADISTEAINIPIKAETVNSLSNHKVPHTHNSLAIPEGSHTNASLENHESPSNMTSSLKILEGPRTISTLENREKPSTVASLGTLEEARTINSLESPENPQCNTNKAQNSNTTTSSSEVEILNVSKGLGVEQSFFFNDELNAMYPNFDKIVNEHVTFPETAEIIKERIKLIAADVEHINKALEIKEKECNQLLYVKHTKEQILARLLRKIKRNEVNVDENAIEAIASRELGIVPKQTQLKEPPSKRRKVEPRTAQEILEQGANMSMDEVLRAKAQNNLDTNFIDDTLKKFGISPFKKDANAKQSSNKSKYMNREFLDTKKNFSVPENDSYQQSRLPNFNNRMDHQQADTSERGQNLLLNLLTTDNDSDDGSVSFNMQNVEHQSTIGNILDTWASQRQQQQQLQRTQQRFQNSHDRDDDTYEVIIEKKAMTKPTNSFPILNRSKNTLPNSDETLVVHLNVSDFKDNNTSTQKFRGNIANNFICQHCGIHKAQYVCAECENQWYCSRSCQVKAWDSHCETCE